MAATNSTPPLLPLALLAPSPRYAAAAIARNLGLYVLALAVLPWLERWNVWAPLAASPLVGLAYYRLTVVMHDCIHATLMGTPRANRLLGTILGTLSGIEFQAFTRLHWQHHRIVGEPEDPQGADYLVGWSMTPGALVAHLLRPLAGWNLFKLGQVFRALKQAGPRNAARGPVASLLVVSVQLAVAAIVSDGLRFWWLAPLPVLSAATFGLFFAQLRGFAEHVAMPGAEPRGFVRSHRPTIFDRIFLYDLNFNYHREHHLYPVVPSCRLPELHRRLVEMEEVEAVATGMLGTLRQRIAAARGSGMASEPAGA